METFTLSLPLLCMICFFVFFTCFRDTDNARENISEYFFDISH